MDSTLDKRIAAMRGSLMDTALEAAESRGQRLAGVAHDSGKEAMRFLPAHEGRSILAWITS